MKKNKYLIYNIRQEVVLPNGNVKNIGINTKPIITDDVDDFKRQILSELHKMEEWKDCKINLYFSYNEFKNEFLS